MKKAIKVITIAVGLTIVISNVNAAHYTDLGDCKDPGYKAIAGINVQYDDKEFRKRLPMQVENVLYRTYKQVFVEKGGFQKYSDFVSKEEFLKPDSIQAAVEVVTGCVVAEYKKLKVEKLILTVTNNLNRRK